VHVSLSGVGRTRRDRKIINWKQKLEQSSMKKEQRKIHTYMYNNRNEYNRRAKHIWRKNYEMGSEMCKDKQKIIAREN
jgi:hypothetical protein